jgi:radical SAM protein with 4Fe4S-binding SPASM domain
MADNPECEVIHPDGKIAKCEHFDESLVIGDVFSPERDEEIIQAWKERVFCDNCDGCPLRPVCIKLKMCPWSRYGCSEATKELRVSNMRDCMRNYYFAHRGGVPQEPKQL